MLREVSLLRFLSSAIKSFFSRTFLIFSYDFFKVIPKIRDNDRREGGQNGNRRFLS